MFIDREPFKEEYDGFVVTQCEGQLSGMYMIKSVQGRLPDMLNGKFTSFRKACDHIDTWNRMKKPRVKQASGEN